MRLGEELVSNDKQKTPVVSDRGFFLGGDSAEVRTQDPILKRDVLYQLSY